MPNCQLLLLPYTTFSQARPAEKIPLQADPPPHPGSWIPGLRTLTSSYLGFLSFLSYVTHPPNAAHSLDVISSSLPPNLPIKGYSDSQMSWVPSWTHWTHASNAENRLSTAPQFLCRSWEVSWKSPVLGHSCKLQYTYPLCHYPSKWRFPLFWTFFWLSPKITSPGDLMVAVNRQLWQPQSPYPLSWCLNYQR